MVHWYWSVPKYFIFLTKPKWSPVWYWPLWSWYHLLVIGLLEEDPSDKAGDLSIALVRIWAAILANSSLDFSTRIDSMEDFEVESLSFSFSWVFLGNSSLINPMMRVSLNLSHHFKENCRIRISPLFSILYYHLTIQGKGRGGKIFNEPCLRVF